MGRAGSTDGEVVRARLDAVLAGRPHRGAGDAAVAGPVAPRVDPQDLDDDGMDEEDLDDGSDVDGLVDGGGRARGGRRVRRGHGRHGHGRHGAGQGAADRWSVAEEPDLVEGLGLWPQLRAALADRVPPSVRAARWAVPLPAVTATLLVAAVVVVALAVRSSATAPGLPVPVRAPVAAAGAPTPVEALGGTPTTSATARGTAAPPAATPGAPPAAPPEVPAAPAPSGATTPPGAAVAEELLVHVVGRVAAPGVVRLPVGARVVDALEAAGGATPEADLARVNLARPVVDGEQVLVPAPGEEPGPLVVAAPGAPAAGTSTPGTSTGAAGAPAAPGGGAGDGGAWGGGLLDLNRAGLADLDGLPGIGPVLAQRILDTREQLGAFTSVEELGEVSGIGEARLAELRELVVV
ncbi:helix-hairpin-helix domain-containing protein [uncultured Pseudokineococcus sp.]|uniref:helix-hairpin-helix domain-containing protein n=1 Tax=uncultured Pseudokineococcus sp. TaxID=1642928 RepID=UPI002617CBDA|nr:helix-hairpin-helix domain-containing protein [uncultured Pseudokineococcus sp.]